MSRFHPFPRRLALLPLVVITLVIVAHQFTATTSAENTASGGISGRVTVASSGAPISGARIHLLTNNFQFVVFTWTNTDGYYNTNSWPAGSYVVDVQAEGYGGLYFKDACDDSGIEFIVVTDGSVTPNIDVGLAPESIVSGHVYAADGSTPVEGATVEIMPSAGGQIKWATTNSEGAYSIGGLSTCEYRITASADGYASENYEDTIQVTQPNPVTDINFTLGSDVIVSGRVVEFNTGQPVGDTQVMLMSFETGDIHETRSQPATGDFSLAVPPGQYVIYTEREGYASSRWNGFLVLHAVAGQALSGIELAIAPAAYIRPRIYEADGVTPLAGIRVRVANIIQGDINIGDGTPFSDADGRFDDDLVVPAGWDIYARSYRSNATLDYMSMWYSSTGSVLSINQAEPLNLTIGEIAEIALPVSKAPTAIITPTGGGEVSLETSYASTIAIPPGAVDEDTVLTMQPETGQFMPPLASFPDGFSAYAATGSGGRTTSLNLPFTITIDYEDQYIPLGVDEQDLSLYYNGQIDDNGWGWIKIPTTVDPVNNILTAELDQLSSYLVMAPREGAYMPLLSDR